MPSWWNTDRSGDEGLLRRRSHHVGGVGVVVVLTIMNLCCFTTSHAHLHARLPLRMAARHANHHRRAFVVSLPRGGESVAATQDDDDEEEEIDLDNILSESEEESDEETEEEMVEEEEEEEEEEEGPVVSNNDPMRVVVQTGLLLSSPESSTTKDDEGSSSAQRLLDQTLELTCLKSRTVASIQQTLARQLKGRPPATLIQLLHEGRVLSPDETLHELLEDAEEEDEEDEDEDDNNDMKSIHLTLDMVPPVDPKFATEWRDLLPRISNSDLLDAYAANLAALHWNSRFLLEHDDETTEVAATASAAKVVAMRQHALRIRDQLRNNYVSPSQANDNDDVVQSKWLEALAPALEAEQQQQQEGQSGTILASRRRKAGGAKMNVKRVLQRNLNINWPDTIRNFFLFLFFGYFGGRSSFSRSLMLLGAPMCFILQARPVKIAMKQLFYCLGKPPGIFLSLLPAPQQAIMSLDYHAAMKDLYNIDPTESIMNDDDNDDDDTMDNMEQDFINDEVDDDDYNFDDDSEYDE